jgi:hypothetical protein
MSAILVQLVKTQTNLPSGKTFASTQVVVKDASGASQSFSLVGTESPPWSVAATVAAGAGSVTATDLASDGSALGTPATQSYTTSGATGTQFPATTGITVTTTTP